MIPESAGIGNHHVGCPRSRLVTRPSMPRALVRSNGACIARENNAELQRVSEVMGENALRPEVDRIRIHHTCEMFRIGALAALSFSRLASCYYPSISTPLFSRPPPPPIIDIDPSIGPPAGRQCPPWVHIGHTDDARVPGTESTCVTCDERRHPMSPLDASMSETRQDRHTDTLSQCVFHHPAAN